MTAIDKSYAWERCDIMIIWVIDRIFYILGTMTDKLSPFLLVVRIKEKITTLKRGKRYVADKTFELTRK